MMSTHDKLHAPSGLRKTQSAIVEHSSMEKMAGSFPHKEGPLSTSATKTINQFICNTCSSPLNLDKSFLDVESTALTELGIANQHGDGSTFLSASSSAASPMSELSRDVAAAARLFDLVSGAGELDHPLCEDCADSLLDQLDRELKATEELCRDYTTALAKLDSSPSEDILSNENRGAMTELATLEAEAARLRDDIGRLEAESGHLDNEIAKEMEEQKKLLLEQQKYYRRYVDVKRKSCDLEDDYYSIRLAHTWADRQLARLTQTSGLSAAFHIWHSDHFGTINGLRLGRLPTAPVDSAELNAAWGAATMLLHALAKRLNIKFRRFRPVPYGSHSYIEVIGDQESENADINQSVGTSQIPTQTLPLYTTGGGIRFIWDERYDDAMAAFAECVSQLAAAVDVKSDGNVKLPYPVDDRGRLLDRASGQHFSVRSRLNSEQHWTRALKMLLTNLKWATSFVSSSYVNSNNAPMAPPSSTFSPPPRDEITEQIAAPRGPLSAPRPFSASPSSIN